MLKDSTLIKPEPPGAEALADRESLEVWGFADTRFRVNERGHVELTGGRYPLCDAELPYLLPWVRGVLGLEVDVRDTYTPSYPPKISLSRNNPEFLTELKRIFSEGQLSQDEKARLRHGHGHTQAEMYAIKYDKIERVPDWVVYPEEEDQVQALVQAALRYNVCLIPFGGGTCVTEALMCPVNEHRMVVSVDMRRMNKVLWIDPVNQMACIQAGAVGRGIMTQLARYGFTLGHEPDSVEFSTLGGWIATHASGMKKNKYGNIEDIVLDMNVVTAEGKLERSNVCPRESVGLDPRKWMFGSEGNLGIITSAVVKIFPLPEVQKYGSILFPTFSDGVEFLYELTRKGLAPASIRLVDNLQFQFGLALKHAPRGLKILKSKLEKFIVTKIKGFDPQQMVAYLGFEGTAEEVALQEKQLYALAKKWKGIKAGADNGRRGYQLTFSIAYIRDFVMNYYLLAESFETSVPWSQVQALCENVKQRLYTEHAKRGLPGRPFVTCRVTQVYQTGVCVYFYFGYYFKGLKNPSEVFAEMEVAARQEILKNGGSLSHHHGIGKLREGFLKDIKSPATLKFNQQAKHAVDPLNIFGSGNQGLGTDEGEGTSPSKEVVGI
jgi:alkyldihydroxyacetonephosphate synthase